MAIATSTVPRTRAPMTASRKLTLWAGVLYLLTFAGSIPALGFYDAVLNDPNFVFGAGSETSVYWGALGEVLTGLAGIGTAVALYPIVRRQSRTGALGFVSSRVLEAAMIFVGIVSLLSVVTLRQDAVANPATLTTTTDALIAVHDWTFLLGPGLAAVINAGCLATVLYRSRLVPRIIPTVGLIGAPLLFVSFLATLFGAYEQVSSPAMLMALPIAAWEFSLGVWMAFKGFRPSPLTDAVDAEVAQRHDLAA
jgi:hypothetical protein